MLVEILGSHGARVRVYWLHNGVEILSLGSYAIECPLLLALRSCSLSRLAAFATHDRVILGEYQIALGKGTQVLGAVHGRDWVVTVVAVHIHARRAEAEVHLGLDAHLSLEVCLSRILVFFLDGICGPGSDVVDVCVVDELVDA